MKNALVIAALTAGLVVTGGAVARADQGTQAGQSTTQVRAEARDTSHQLRADNRCASRAEYRQVRTDSAGRDGSTRRQVHRIIGFKGRLRSRTRTEGHVYESRIYRGCTARAAKALVFFRTDRAYYKVRKS